MKLRIPLFCASLALVSGLVHPDPCCVPDPCRYSLSPAPKKVVTSSKVRPGRSQVSSTMTTDPLTVKDPAFSVPWVYAKQNDTKSERLLGWMLTHDWKLTLDKRTKQPRQVKTYPRVRYNGPSGRRYDDGLRVMAGFPPSDEPVRIILWIPTTESNYLNR